MCAQVMPRELRLAAPPTMPQARSYMFKVQSSNSTYDSSGSNTIQINIPRLQRSYLTKDSYLRFRMTTTFVTATAVPDLLLDTPGAFGFFDKIEVYDYLGSTLLESTSGHGQLLATLLDISSNPNEFGFHFNTTAGTQPGSVVLDSATQQTAAGTATATENKLKLKNTAATITASGLTPNAQVADVYMDPIELSRFTFNTQAAQRGQVLSKAANTSSGTTYWEFAIPLFSFLGGLGQKFTPLHNGFTIMLTLNPAERAMGAGAIALNAANGTASNFPTSFVLSNVNFCCQVLELGPQAESMLLSSAGGKPLIVPTKAFRNYTTQIAASSSTFKLDLNLNVASLTNLLWIMRETSPTTTNLPYRDIKWLSSRCRNYLQSWYFQYGSSILPQTSGIQAAPPPGVTLQNGGHDECYLELLKSRHSINADSFDTMIDRESYTIDQTNATLAAGSTGNPILAVANYSKRGTFAAGLDLELVSGRSQNLICGLNTNGMNTSIYGTFWNGSTQASGTEIVQLDCWAEYDSFINISPGIATTVSF